MLGNNVLKWVAALATGTTLELSHSHALEDE
jgi:hypothetical protein